MPLIVVSCSGGARMQESILSLMPSTPPGIQQHGWARAAGFFYALLRSDIGATVEEHFALAVVIDTLEFLYLAFEPYGNKLPSDAELRNGLIRLIKCLSGKYATILMKLLPVYKWQDRHKIFQDIFLHLWCSSSCKPNNRHIS